MRSAHNLRWSLAEMPRTSPSSMILLPSGGKIWRRVPREAFRATRTNGAFGGGVGSLCEGAYC
jgi:hypothetical protein